MENPREAEVILTEKIISFIKKTTANKTIKDGLMKELKPYLDIDDKSSSENPQTIPFRLVKAVHNAFNNGVYCNLYV